MAVLGETTILSVNLNFCHSLASSAGFASAAWHHRLEPHRHGERYGSSEGRLTRLELNKDDDEERETDRGRDRELVRLLEAVPQFRHGDRGGLSIERVGGRKAKSEVADTFRLSLTPRVD